MTIIAGVITLRNGGILMLEEGDELMQSMVQVYYSEGQPAFTPIIIRKGSKCEQNVFKIDSRYAHAIFLDNGVELSESNLVIHFEGETAESAFRPNEEEKDVAT